MFFHIISSDSFAMDNGRLNGDPPKRRETTFDVTQTFSKTRLRLKNWRMRQDLKRKF